MKNLPYDATESSLRSSFSPFGLIPPGGVRLGLTASLSGKGFGYVTFAEPEFGLCLPAAQAMQVLLNTCW